jgi:hypothetical protein
VVIVDLVDSQLRLIINYHEEEARLIDCCSPLFCVPCVRQVTSKGGGKQILVTRCRRFTKENRKRHKYINTKVGHRERLYGVKIIKILAIENLTLGHL